MCGAALRRAESADFGTRLGTLNSARGGKALVGNGVALRPGPHPGHIGEPRGRVRAGAVVTDVSLRGASVARSATRRASCSPMSGLAPAMSLKASRRAQPGTRQVSPPGAEPGMSARARRGASVGERGEQPTAERPNDAGLPVARSTRQLDRREHCRRRLAGASTDRALPRALVSARLGASVGRLPLVLREMHDVLGVADRGASRSSPHVLMRLVAASCAAVVRWVTPGQGGLLWR